MKVGSLLRKLIKILLWIVFAGLLGFFVLGYVKFDGGIKGYFTYLNEKNWSESISKVSFWKPSTYGNVFWEAGVDEGGIMNTEGLMGDLNVDELEIDGLSGLDEDVDVFDPEFQDDFDEFFAPKDDDVDKKDLSVDSEFGEVREESAGFGFVDEDGVNKEDASAEIGSGDLKLSDNKKSLLEKGGVN